LRALDALTTMTGSFFLVALVAFSTALSVRVLLAVVVFLQLDYLLDIHVNILSAHVGQCFLGTIELLHAKFHWELDLEEHEKVSVLVRLFVERKALVLDGLDLVGFDDLTGVVLDAELVTIEVSDNEVDAGQSLEERNFLLNEEIGSLTLEHLVGQFLDYNYDITGLSSWELVSLAMEGILAAIGRSLVNISLEHLSLFADLLSVAGLALELIVDDLSLSHAIVTRSAGL